SAGGAEGQWLTFAALSVVALSALAAGAVIFLARRVLRVAIDPLQQLARSAVQISASGQARIVDADRQDEIGELARALQAWKDASMERQILADGAPIGICRMDLSGRVITANAALVAMHGGTSDRKGHAELAAKIQRELLPHMVPEVEGYEVAGACLSAMEVAGDFYDWVLDDEGQLQFTVADVMGKGMGAALVTATLRAVLRA